MKHHCIIFRVKKQALEVEEAFGNALLDCHCIYHLAGDKKICSNQRQLLNRAASVQAQARSITVFYVQRIEHVLSLASSRNVYWQVFIKLIEGAASGAINEPRMKG